MVKKTFGLANYLTKRDAAAGTFEGVFNRTAARPDAPRNLGGPQAIARDEWGDQVATPDDLKATIATGGASSVPVSDLQMNLVETARSATLRPNDRITLLDQARPITTEHDAAIYLRQAAERIRQVRQSRATAST
jgi:hypothetical protein